MKPVAIFRHTHTEGPGYFATFLDSKNISWQLIAIDQGQTVPASSSLFSGLVFMGGPMSVNDDLPWIPPVLNLIQHAVNNAVPVLGHCLGGQLMSKALGGVVTKNRTKEIGWGEVSVPDHPEAKEWFGNIQNFLSFHWHGETFSIPKGATRILSSPYCDNQAFAMGKHLALQCHVEMTAELIKTWCDVGADEIANSPGPAVQQPDEIQKDLMQRTKTLNQYADKLYEHWIKGLRA
jgi:GMP synthase-like glutamine amidotransferase